MWGYLRNHFTSVYFMSIYVTFVCKNEGGGGGSSFRRHNFSKLIIAVNHCCLPIVFFFFFLPSSPFVPLPTAAHTAYSQISYSQAPQRAPLHMRARESVKRGGRGFEVLLMGFAACFDGDSCPTSIWSPVELFL